MKTLKVLNLYAGIGGNRKLWTGVNVTAVENDKRISEAYKENFPTDILVVGDAMDYLRKHRNEFDFIWASPPCQKHSRMMKANRHDVADYFDASLWQIIIFLKHFYDGLWVVENVRPYYQPLIKPTKILGRHYFWSNFAIGAYEVPNIKNFIKQDTVKKSEKIKQWLGIHYTGNIYYKGNHCSCQVLRNAVHPKTGKHIFNCATSAMTGIVK